MTVQTQNDILPNKSSATTQNQHGAEPSFVFR